MMRAALLDAKSYVINVIEVPYIEFMPNLIPAELDGSPGDFWDGTRFVRSDDPAYPPREV